MLEEPWIHWFHMGTVDHTDISLPLEEFDPGPKKTIPSPFKGLRGAYTEVSAFSISVVSCLSLATLRQLGRKGRSLGWYTLIIHNSVV